MSCVATWGGDDANPTPASLKTRNIPKSFLTFSIFKKKKKRKKKRKTNPETTIWTKHYPLYGLYEKTIKLDIHLRI